MASKSGSKCRTVIAVHAFCLVDNAGHTVCSRVDKLVHVGLFVDGQPQLCI